jgi:hypothetical protein
MCYAAAIPIVTLIISAAATAYSVDAQNKQVGAENKSRSIAAESARESFRNQASDTNLRLQQEQEAAVNAKIENSKRAAEARGTARAAAGQSGVAGLSVDNLLADFYRQEAGFRFVTDSNLSAATEQSQRELKGLRATSQSRENSLRPEALPGYLGAGLRIAGQGVQAYDQYQTYSNPSYKK